MIKDILIVGLGSFIGGTLRYMLSIAFNKIVRTCTFPIGILVVNVLGCFFIGVLYSYFKNRVGESLLPLLLMTGVLGGFTTFSTFSSGSIPTSIAILFTKATTASFSSKNIL